MYNRMKYKLMNHIREIRQSKNLTQTELGLIVGCSQNTISSIENYKYFPTAFLAALICEALDTKFEDLFYLVHYWEV